MSLSEKLHAGGFLISEADGHISRENGVLHAGHLYPGTVLGQILTAGAATAVGTPTGTGAITVSAAMGIHAMPGTYQLVCVAAASNAGTFNLYAPDGTLVRQITVAGGATASSHLTITIADATDFIVGDTFEIVVTAGNFVQMALAGTDGSQQASAILFAESDASVTADQPICVVKRSAEVNGNELTWPGSISAAQLVVGKAQLAANQVIVR